MIEKGDDEKRLARQTAVSHLIALISDLEL
jgi:hypothetical protein